MTRKAVETGALWKPWKNGDIKQTTLGIEFFHRSHRFYNEIHPPKNETPRLQKCNLCAREKLLPMNRELQGPTGEIEILLVYATPMGLRSEGRCL